MASSLEIIPPCKHTSQQPSNSSAVNVGWLSHIPLDKRNNPDTSSTQNFPKIKSNFPSMSEQVVFIKEFFESYEDKSFA